MNNQPNPDTSDPTTSSRSSDDFLARDKEPSLRLHEPESLISNIISNIDPISGADIGNLEGKPYLVDGNIKMYFESEQTRQAYIDKSKNHTLKLPDNPSENGEVEG